jgi:manganese/zinc/iron transport system ATP- binding protein
VEVQDLTVAYDRKPVLFDVDVTIPRGVMAAILGPNGAGKTTLLRTILGLIKPAAGNIRVLGQPLARVRNQLGYVPQRTSVDWTFPATVLDVVLMGTYGQLGWFRRPGSRQRLQAMEALERLHVANLSNRPIGELSGGQQQRVFLARALVQNAPLLLLDEPFAGIDAITEKAIVELLRELRDQGTTIVAVHHDLHTVNDYFDWVLLLNRRPVAAGTTESTFHTENLRRAYGSRVSILGSVGQI